MGWKENLMGEINIRISRRKNAVIKVRSIEEKIWGEERVDNIFSTLHLDKPITIKFEIENQSIVII